MGTSLSLFPALVLLLSLPILNPARGSDLNYLYHYCSGNDTSATDYTTFKAELLALLSSLSSNATNNTAGYHRASFGRRPTKANGVFLCRGDVTTQTCRNCVSFATVDVIRRCPAAKWAVVWYSECFLHYSNESFFGVIDQDPGVVIWDDAKPRDQERFDRVTRTAMEEIGNSSANCPPGERKFATTEANVSAAQRVYGLAQCLPDLSSSDCYRCFRRAFSDFGKHTNGKSAGCALYTSCQLRYHVSLFYHPTPQTFRPPVASPEPTPPGKRLVCAGKGSRTAVCIVVPVIGFLVLLSFLFYFIYRWRAKRKTKDESNRPNQSVQFDLATIRCSTNNFADANKIGMGGFGSVHKGMLRNEQEIAVKRLSETSTQGVEEFKNEVLVVAKLQHRNLVKLLGFCAEKKERMLVYEFVPNKSLDYFLFDDVRRGVLDWPSRHKIIKGIGRGLLYLHTDSRLRIIHRDLKASNILLDAKMNPKISDFGMARIIGENQSQKQEQTRKVVGIYGYISPEYAMYGKISVKSDVFSFGVLLLEIISGRGNTSFYKPNQADNLLTYAWKFWKDGKPLELMDPSVEDSYTSNEVSRCVQIGLLCVQEDPEVRPDMGRVVTMLSSASVTLPLPLKTAFFYGTETKLSAQVESGESTSSSRLYSVNGASITDLEPR